MRRPIEVSSVTYNSSQPWPFPASLMLGFHAEAKTTEIIVDKANSKRRAGTSDLAASPTRTTKLPPAAQGFDRAAAARGMAEAIARTQNVRHALTLFFFVLISAKIIAGSFYGQVTEEAAKEGEFVLWSKSDKLAQKARCSISTQERCVRTTFS